MSRCRLIVESASFDNVIKAHFSPGFCSNVWLLRSTRAWSLPTRAGRRQVDDLVTTSNRACPGSIGSQRRGSRRRNAPRAESDIAHRSCNSIYRSPPVANDLKRQAADLHPAGRVAPSWIAARPKLGEIAAERDCQFQRHCAALRVEQGSKRRDRTRIGRRKSSCRRLSACSRVRNPARHQAMDI